MLPNWQTRLFDWVEVAKRTPFEWGKFDCALAVCDAVKAMTGNDVASDFRGQYNSALTCKRVMREKGYESYTELGDDRLGERLPDDEKQRTPKGTISLISVNQIETFCVNLGMSVLVTDEFGLKEIPSKSDEIQILKTWRAE